MGFLLMVTLPGCSLGFLQPQKLAKLPAFNLSSSSFASTGLHAQGRLNPLACHKTRAYRPSVNRFMPAFIRSVLYKNRISHQFHPVVEIVRVYPSPLSRHVTLVNLPASERKTPNKNMFPQFSVYFCLTFV